MGLFNKLREPIFLKETSSAQKQLEQLQAVERERLSEDMKAQLDREIKLPLCWFVHSKATHFHGWLL